MALPRSPDAVWPEPVTGVTVSGLRFASLERPGPVVAVRLTVAVGARDDRVPGAAHMLEHLLFRTPEGAAARRAIEALGGEVGATTTREQLSVDVVVLPQDLLAALDAIRTLVRSRPRQTDLERERPVVLRELAHEEEERRRIWQLQAEALYGRDHALARPIAGTRESVGALTLGEIDRCAAGLVSPAAAVAVVGPVDAETIADAVEDLVPSGSGRAVQLAIAPTRPAGRRHDERASRLLHLAVGWRFAGLDDPHLPALRIAEIILAHGSGSRLYERLRTRRRLAYRVSTVLIPYRDAGHLSAVTAVEPSNADQAETAIVDELERLAARGPSWIELETARRQFHGNRARAFESSRRLAGYVATQLLWDRLTPVGLEQEQISAVGAGSIRDACAYLLRSTHHAVASVGRALPEPTE